MVTFLRLQVYERVGILQVEVYKRANLSFRYVKLLKTANDALYGCEKVIVIYSYLKTAH